MPFGLRSTPPPSLIRNRPVRPCRSWPAPGGPPTSGRSSPTIVGALQPALRGRESVARRAGWPGEFVARSEPNGYTLLYANSQRARRQSPLCRNEHALRIRTAFAPIVSSPIAQKAARGDPKVPYRVPVQDSSPGRSNPGRLNFATPASGRCRTLPMNCSRWKPGSRRSTSLTGRSAPLTAVITGQGRRFFSTWAHPGESGEVRAPRHHRRDRDADCPTSRRSPRAAIRS